MKETVVSLFPNYKNNPYLPSISDVSRILLKTIDTDLSDSDWIQIAKDYMRLHL